MVVRAEEKATMDLSEGVEGGTDYSGILAGACYAITHSIALYAFSLPLLQVASNQ